MQERNLKENLILKNGEYYYEGNLVLENGEYYLKGDLFISGGTLIMTNANLVVEGNLKVFPSFNEDGSIASPISAATIVDGGIYAKSISIFSNIVIKNGNICSFTNLDCENIYSANGDINVGGNANVFNVYCRNYLVDGTNSSYNIEADESVYIMDYSNNFNITAPDVFLGNGGDFNGLDITANNFEIGDRSHIKNCFFRHFLK